MNVQWCENRDFFLALSLSILFCRSLHTLSLLFTLFLSLSRSLCSCSFSFQSKLIIIRLEIVVLTDLNVTFLVMLASYRLLLVGCH